MVDGFFHKVIEKVNRSPAGSCGSFRRSWQPGIIRDEHSSVETGSRLGTKLTTGKNGNRTVRPLRVTLLTRSPVTPRFAYRPERSVLYLYFRPFANDIYHERRNVIENTGTNPRWLVVTTLRLYRSEWSRGRETFPRFVSIRSVVPGPSLHGLRRGVTFERNRAR